MSSNNHKPRRNRNTKSTNDNGKEYENKNYENMTLEEILEGVDLNDRVTLKKIHEGMTNRFLNRERIIFEKQLIRERLEKNLAKKEAELAVYRALQTVANKMNGQEDNKNKEDVKKDNENKAGLTKDNENKEDVRKDNKNKEVVTKNNKNKISLTKDNKNKISLTKDNENKEDSSKDKKIKDDATKANKNKEVAQGTQNKPGPSKSRKARAKNHNK